MKQITIYEFLKKNEGVIKNGWVAMNKDKSWSWFNYYPKRGDKLVKFWYGGGLEHKKLPFAVLTSHHLMGLGKIV